MLRAISKWYKNKFDNKEVAVFIGIILSIVLVIDFFGSILAPILASIVIAFLLDPLIIFLNKKCKLPFALSFYIVFLGFIFFIILMLFVLVPLLIHQFVAFMKAIPETLPGLEKILLDFSNKYPSIITEERINDLFGAIKNIRIDNLSKYFNQLLSFSLNSLPIIFNILLYVFLVPLLVFFMISDKKNINAWINTILPNDKGGLVEVWNDVKPQLLNYVKGKVLEAIIMTVSSYLLFLYFDLNYGLLLAIGVGLSVILPYVGVVIISIPIFFISAIQFGITSDFATLMLIYGVLQLIDGNVLVPLLYSGAVSLHPIAVIVAILFFGGIWGFWGLFFAIPLGALCKSALTLCIKHIQITKIKNESKIY